MVEFEDIVDEIDLEFRLHGYNFSKKSISQAIRSPQTIPIEEITEVNPVSHDIRFPFIPS